MSDREPTVEQGRVLQNILAGVRETTNFDREVDAMRALMDCVRSGWVINGRLTPLGHAQLGKPRKTNRFEITVLGRGDEKCP